MFQSAGELVEEAMREYVPPNQPNICNPKNLTRAANRVRTQIRPEEPKDLQFEVNALIILLYTYFTTSLFSTYYIMQII